MLIDHRVDDVDEGFIARKKPVAAGQQISFEPAFTHMLAQDFHDTAVGAEIGIDVFRLSHLLLA